MLVCDMSVCDIYSRKQSKAEGSATAIDATKENNHA